MVPSTSMLHAQKRGAFTALQSYIYWSIISNQMCTIWTATLTRSDNMQIHTKMVPNEKQEIIDAYSVFLLSPSSSVCWKAHFWFSLIRRFHHLFTILMKYCVYKINTHRPCFNWIWQATRGRTSGGPVCLHQQKKGIYSLPIFGGVSVFFWWRFMLTGVTAVWFIRLTNWEECREAGSTCTHFLHFQTSWSPTGGEIPAHSLNLFTQLD